MKTYLLNIYRVQFQSGDTEIVAAHSFYHLLEIVKSIKNIPDLDDKNLPNDKIIDTISCIISNVKYQNK